MGKKARELKKKAERSAKKAAEMAHKAEIARRMRVAAEKRAKMERVVKHLKEKASKRERAAKAKERKTKAQERGAKLRERRAKAIAEQERKAKKKAREMHAKYQERLLKERKAKESAQKAKERFAKKVERASKIRRERAVKAAKEKKKKAAEKALKVLRREHAKKKEKMRKAVQERRAKEKSSKERLTKAKERAFKKKSYGFVHKYKKRWPHCQNIKCLTGSLEHFKSQCLNYGHCNGFSFTRIRNHKYTGSTRGNGCLKQKCVNDGNRGFGHGSHGYWIKMHKSLIKPVKPPAPKPIPWKKVKVQPKFGGNVLAFKAFCVLSHNKIKAMSKHSNNLSSLGSFLIRYGARQSSNALGEYAALHKAYLHFYKLGLGKYMIRRLHTALHNGGALTDIVSMGHTYKTLSYYRLGLVTQPSMFDKIKISLRNFVKALSDTTKRNKKMVYSVKFHSKHNCKCQPPKKSVLTFVNHRLIGARCHKWFAYDKKPWCYVDKACKGATKAQTGMYYAVC